MSDAPLTARRIVVGGGTGDVGVDVVAALLDAGADVVVPVRTTAKADVLRAAVGHEARLSFIEGFPSDDDGVRKLAGDIGEVHGAVATIGSWRRASALMAMPLTEWNQVASANLTAHFLFAKAVVPRIAAGGQYIMINGAGALQPVPNSGHVSIMASAQIMMGEALRAENPQVLFHTLMLRSIIATRARAKPDPSWVTSRQVGETVCWMLGDQGRLTAGSTVTLSAASTARRMA